MYLKCKYYVIWRNACNAQQSFAKDFDFAYHRGTRRKKPKKASTYPNSKEPTNPANNMDNSKNDIELTDDDQKEMTDFLLEVCIWTIIKYLPLLNLRFDIALYRFTYFKQNTLSCDQLIRLCMLGEEIRKCDELFKPVITDYGKCKYVILYKFQTFIFMAIYDITLMVKFLHIFKGCTFNILPLPLLLHNA